MDGAMVEQIEKKLRMPFARLDLRADGYALHARVEQISKTGMRWGVVLYVDGRFSVKNLKPDSEIGAKFYPLRERCLMKRNDYVECVKALGKREADELWAMSRRKYRQPWFGSGRALALHLKKHCTSVEVVETTVSGVEVEVQ